MSNSSLPEDVMIEIFSRLPSKSAGRCKCLSKTWHTKLSTSQFINLHSLNKPYQESLFLITVKPSIYRPRARRITFPYSLQTVSIPIDGHSVVWSNFYLPIKCPRLVGCCNGLVLMLCEWDDQLYVVNPVTQQHIIVPISTAIVSDSEKMYGFGYDNCTDDYKIVRLCYVDKKDREYADDYKVVRLCYMDEKERKYPDHVGSFLVCVEVYSLKMGVWKTVGTSPYWYHPHAHGAFVNGALHWFASVSKAPNYKAVAAFDLVNEVFNEIAIPDSGGKMYHDLYAFDEHLYLVRSCDDQIDVWILKEYGLVDSWTNFKVSYPDNSVSRSVTMYRPLYMKGEEEGVFIDNTQQLAIHTLVSCDFKERTMNAMLVNGVVPDYFAGCTFVDSLVSPIPIR